MSAVKLRQQFIMNDSAFMMQAIMRAQIFEETETSVIVEYIRLFCPPQESNHYFQTVVAHLKNRICSILLLEQQHWPQYLQLPKFAALSAKANATLKLIFQTVWNRFSEEKAAWEVAAHRHLGFSGDGRGSFAHPERATLFNVYHPPNFPQPNIVPPQAAFRQQPTFPNFPIPQAEQRRPTDWNQFDFSQPKEQDRKAGKNKQIRKQKTIMKEEESREPAPIIVPPLSGLRQKAPEIQIKFLLPSASKQDFSLCRCKGDQAGSSKSKTFKCSVCEAQFHIDCLKISHPREKCPKCFLTQPWIFANTPGVVAKSGWVSLSNQPVPVQVTDDEVAVLRQQLKVLMEPQEFQLRLLTVNDAKKASSVLQPERYVISLMKEHINQIIRQKSLVIESMKNEDEEDQTKCEIIYFSLLCTTRRSEEQIINEVVSNEDPNGPLFDRRFQQMPTERSISMSLINPGRGFCIEIPVRSEKCEHLQVFDLKSFLREERDKGHMAYECPICSMPFSLKNSLHFDGLFYLVSNIINQKYSHNEVKPTRFLYYPNKEIKLYRGDNEKPMLTLTLEDRQKYLQNGILPQKNYPDSSLIIPTSLPID